MKSLLENLKVFFRLRLRNLLGQLQIIHFRFH